MVCRREERVGARRGEGDGERRVELVAVADARDVSARAASIAAATAAEDAPFPRPLALLPFLSSSSSSSGRMALRSEMVVLAPVATDAASGRPPSLSESGPEMVEAE